MVSIQDFDSCSIGSNPVRFTKRNIVQLDRILGYDPKDASSSLAIPTINFYVIIMKTRILFQIKVKNGINKINKLLAKVASGYIKSVSKTLYPSGSEEVKHKNDRHRIFHK